MRQNYRVCSTTQQFNTAIVLKGSNVRELPAPSAACGIGLESVQKIHKGFSKGSAVMIVSGILTKSEVPPKGPRTNRADVAAERRWSRAAPALPFLRAARGVNGPHVLQECKALRGLGDLCS